MIDIAGGRRLIVAAALAGLLVRLAFGLLYWVDKPMTHDEHEYLALARSVAEGKGFAYDTPRQPSAPQQIGRAPGYPLFLAMIGAGSRDYPTVPARVKIAQAFLGAVSVWLIGVIALRAAGPAAGVASAAIAACYPPLAWISAYLLSETLYSTLALASVAMLDLAVDRDDRGRAGWIPAVGAGLLAGLAMLTRPAMLFFLPLAAVWLILRRRRALAVALIATSFAVMAPWTIRNARVYDRFVLVASEGGVTFWTGNHPLARGEGDLAANPEIKQADIEFRRAHRDLTAEQLEPLYYREALRYIGEHPAWWIGLLARKAFYTLVPIGPSYTLHSTLYFAASVASYLLVLPLAIAGVRTVGRSRRPPAALFLLAASAVLVCLIFFPQERFRIPVIDPTLIVCAGAACASRLNSR